MLKKKRGFGAFFGDFMHRYGEASGILGSFRTFVLILFAMNSLVDKVVIGRSPISACESVEMARESLSPGFHPIIGRAAQPC